MLKNRGIAKVTLALVLCLGPLHAAEVGQPVPAFNARTIDGQSEMSQRDFLGKVVYVDFWASWCGPCLQSLPTFSRLQEDYGPHGFEVVAINLDENIQDAKNFLSKLSVNYTVLADSSGATPSAFSIQTMPSSFLIDQTGTVRYAHQGYRKGDDAVLRKEIEKLLEVKNARH